MTAIVDEQMARPRFYLVLVGLFAGLAVVLAAVGLYGVVAYVVTQRTREIGVRMALGARRGAVVRLMLWQGLRPAAIGMALGVAGALALSRAIQGLLYDVQPHDPLTFVAVSLSLLAVVVIACAIPHERQAESRPPGVEEEVAAGSEVRRASRAAGSSPSARCRRAAVRRLHFSVTTPCEAERPSACNAPRAPTCTRSGELANRQCQEPGAA
jgi:predicted lysophospholipase L1 biosynthesis ABC-type transport system permease subunit